MPACVLTRYAQPVSNDDGLLKTPLEPMGNFAALETPDARLSEVLAGIARGFPDIKAIVLGDRSGLPIASTYGGHSTLRTTAMATLTLAAVVSKDGETALIKARVRSFGHEILSLFAQMG